MKGIWHEVTEMEKDVVNSYQTKEFVILKFNIELMPPF